MIISSYHCIIQLYCGIVKLFMKEAEVRVLVGTSRIGRMDRIHYQFVVATSPIFCYSFLIDCFTDCLTKFANS